MPIVESRVTLIEPKSRDRQRVHFYFRDHTGHEETPRLDVPVDYDTAAHLTRYTAFLNANIVRREKQAVRGRVLEGENPAAISVDHINAAQKLRAVTKGFMQARAQEAIVVAEWLRDNAKDAELDAVVGATRRVKIRQRQSGVISLKGAIQADEVLRDG